MNINITTYNRPECLERLLSHFRDMTNVYVWNDGSEDTEAYTEAVAGTNALLINSPVNHGKERYWRWVNYILKFNQMVGVGPIVFLADDWEPADMMGVSHYLADHNFWDGMHGPKALNLHNHRSKNWTGTERHDTEQDDDIISYWRSYFIDGQFLAHRAFFDELGWQCMSESEGREMQNTRWKGKPLLGSGVWEYVSRKAVAKNLPMYQVKERLFNHMGVDSQMNPAERARNPV